MSAVPMRTSATRQARGAVDRLVIPIVLGAGLLLRLVLIPFGGYAGDLHQFQQWMARLAAQPPWNFYAAHHLILDHLPGDLWIFLLLAKLHLLAPGIPVVYLLKAVPVLADSGVALLLFLIVTPLSSPRAGTLAAALFLFNPPVIFLSTIWCQWDSVSMLVTLAALSLVLRGHIAWACPVLTYAILIKPTLAMLVFVMAAIYLKWDLVPLWNKGGRRPGGDRLKTVRDVALGTLASLAVLLAVCLPFGTGIPPLPTRWSLLGRIAYAWNYRRYTTTSAFNLWATPIGRHLWPDNRSFLLGISYQIWGTILLLAAITMALLLFWRRGTPAAALWASLVVLLSTFMLTTRQHERYLFPALTLAAALAVIGRRVLWLYGVLSLTFFANLYYIYALFNPAPSPPAPYGTSGFIWALSFVNVGALLLAFVSGYDLERQAVESSEDKDEPGTTMSTSPSRNVRM